MKTNFKDLGIPKLLKLWHNVPEWMRVLVWVGVSAGITGIGSYVLDQPELFKWYGVVNIILFGIKEFNKKRRDK